MSDFFEFVPLDTLFFRGTTPMEAGLSVSNSMFPPSVSVIQGAMWTASCLEQNRSYEVDSFPFTVDGIFVSKFINKQRVLYAPAPATWYYDSIEKIKVGNKFKGFSLITAKKMESSFLKLNMKSSNNVSSFVVPKNEAMSLSGAWISLDCLTNKSTALTENDILLSSDIYSIESRTGNALDTNRNVKEGQLYTANHIRLLDGISIVVKVSSNPGLASTGKMILGGENRVVMYKKLTDIQESFNKISTSETQFVSLVPIVATNEILKDLVASPKLQVIAGWDLKKQFHKPTQSIIPAGAVFTKQINNSCVPLVQK